MAEKETVTPMMQQYHTIKKQCADCLLFYRMGDFFELFLEDAVTAAKELGIALTKRGKQLDGQDIPMCGVPIHSYELYLTKLIQKGYRVAICDQVETPEEAATRGAKGPLKRDIVRIVTRGTLTEDKLLSSSNNYLLAISPLKPDRIRVGLAIADISTGFFCVEQVDLSDLLNAVARWNPEEIVLADVTFSSLPNAGGWDAWKKKLTILPDLRFDEINARTLLESVYDVKTLDIFGKMDPCEIQAGGILVDYVMTTQCCRNMSLLPPKVLQSKEFLSIDAATRRNLELTTSTSETGNGALLSVLDQTVTAAGRRCLIRRLAAPLLKVEKIEKRLDKVDFFVKNPSLCSSIREALGKVYDLERILSRVTLKRVSPRDLGALRHTLHKTQSVQKILENEGIDDGWKNALAGHDDLASLLDRALALELPFYAQNGDFIADGLDPSLDEARRLKNHSSDSLAQLQSRYVQETGINNLKIRSNNVWGVYVEVSTSQTSKIPFNFVHRQTLTNCSRYTTQELIELERAVNQAEKTALTRELELLQELCSRILAERSGLQDLSNALAEIDVATMSAFLAVQNQYVRPVFSDQPTLDIKNGRHPVVEQSCRGLGQPFSGNDCCLNPKDQQFLLVTGPNMAGKSTYLRQNALIIIMAQMGLFVPADYASIGITDRIFSRIGAADDLAYGRSTFMVEMIETAMILHQATVQSFVVLDEIGRGTATYDGLAIAWAVSEYLYDQIQCRTLFATHYHELTHLADQCKAMKSVTASVQEWENKIIFLHKIVEGATQRSYGIHVAQLAGLPKLVIHRATELLNSFEKDIEIEKNVPKKSKKTVAHEDQKKLF